LSKEQLDPSFATASERLVLILASTADQVEFFLQSLVLSNACCTINESIEANFAFAPNLAQQLYYYQF
jgi:hypothetical protein